MAKTASRNLTTGSPTRLVIGFLLPLLGGLLFQQLYNMVDTLVVGRFLGMDALAGVGSTSSVNFLVLGFCIGICNGFVIPVAQKFGEGDEAELRRFVANSIWLSAAFAVVLTVATALLCTPVLHWMNTPDNIFRYAYDYIFVIFLGIPAIILYNLVSGVIRSLGDSRTPIYFLVLSSLLNVALDLLAVAVLGMGVEGPAWATVISQAISGLLCLAIVCFSAPELLLSLLPFVLGGLLVLDGITRLPLAWDAVQNRIPMAWLMILITALPLVLGVVLLFRPFTVVTSVIRFFGVSIILGGVLDLAGTRLR